MHARGSRVYTHACIRGYLIMRITRIYTHTYTMMREKESVAHRAQCVTAPRKFAIPTRVRDTCRARLTRGCVILLSSLRVFSCLLRAREKFVAESVGTLTREDQPRFWSPVVTPPLIPRRVNIRLRDFCLDCVILDPFREGGRGGEEYFLRTFSLL